MHFSRNSLVKNYQARRRRNSISRLLVGISIFAMATYIFFYLSGKLLEDEEEETRLARDKVRIRLAERR